MQNTICHILHTLPLKHVPELKRKFVNKTWGKSCIDTETSVKYILKFFITIFRLLFFFISVFLYSCVLMLSDACQFELSVTVVAWRGEIGGREVK